MTVTSTPERWYMIWNLCLAIAVLLAARLFLVNPILAKLEAILLFCGARK